MILKLGKIKVFAVFSLAILLFFLLLVEFPKPIKAYNIEGGGVCNCNGCSDCTNALNDTTNCTDTVKLTADIIDNVGNCINTPAGFVNKTFDCQDNLIDSTGSDYAFIINQAGNTIQNCEITEFGVAIRLWDNATNSLITNNTISGMTSGLGAIFCGGGASNSTISYNDISDSGSAFAPGINFTDDYTAATNVTITHNTIDNLTGHGIEVIGRTSFTISYNDVTNINVSDRYAFIISESTDTIVDHNTTSNVWSGILDSISPRSTITNNTISSTHGGIYLQGDSGGGEVRDNDLDNLDFHTNNSGQNYLVRDNTIGTLELKGGSYNTIIYNTITGLLDAAGTYATSDVQYNNISNNTFTTTGIAIQFGADWSSYNNTIASNEFNSSINYAISLENSTNNTIEDNDASSAQDFIHLTATTSNNKGCGNIGSIVDDGTNYVSNTSESCYIWQCENISNTGRLGSNRTYLLGQSITDNSGSCMSIQSDNINLNCQSNTIDGDGTGAGVTFTSVTNGSLTNCSVTEFANQYKLENSTNINLNSLFSWSGASTYADVNISGTLIDVDYQGSSIEGLSFSSIDRTINLNKDGVVSIRISPSDTIDLTINTWNTLDTYRKQWQEDATGNRTVTHTIGDLKPNTEYTIKVDSNVQSYETSDSTGQIIFTYSGDFSSHTFEVSETLPETGGRLIPQLILFIGLFIIAYLYLKVEFLNIPHQRVK